MASWPSERLADVDAQGGSTVPSVADYYRDPHVRAAMVEYCGGPHGRPPTAAFLAGLCPHTADMPTWSSAARLVPPDGIDVLWSAGCDIARSLWDGAHLVFLLDLDYQNLDEPGEPFLRPAEVFFKLEPVYRAVQRVLASLGLEAAATVTGRGYHFAGVIPLQDPLIAHLAALTPTTPAWLGDVARRHFGPDGWTITPVHARAHTGLGLLTEYLSQLIHDAATRSASIPVVFNGTVVGTGPVGRECVSLDFSHFGDPLDVRHFRVAFSTYQWHHLRPDVFGSHVGRVAPVLCALPRTREPLQAMLRARSLGLAAGVRAARRQAAGLPLVTRGVTALLASYRTSELATFHARFEHDLARTTSRGPRVPIPATLPPCLSMPLEFPNDLLLKPEHIQHLVRGLMARGWTAADVARLVRAKYEDAGYHWGNRWAWMHPATRAAFDVRVFAGLLATGADTLVDFNCVSAQEKDICPRADCAFDLRRDRDRLRQNRAR